MRFYFMCIFFLCTHVYGQVGIVATTSTTDIETSDDLYLTSTGEILESVTTIDSILMTDVHYAKRIQTKGLLSDHLPSCVKGRFATNRNFSVSLATGNAIIPFDSNIFDINDSFDTASHLFTASVRGDYEIKVQIEAATSIEVGKDFGVSILKNGSVVMKSVYANVDATNPPRRSTETQLQLGPGDSISFRLEGSTAIGSVDLIGDSYDSYFTIHQIR